MKQPSIILLLTTALVAVTALSHASPPPMTVRGYRFESSHRLGGTQVVARSKADFKYLGMVDVCVAVLFLERSRHPSQVLEDRPKRLELLYLRAFKARDFRGITHEVLRRNLSKPEYEMLRPKIERFNALYRPVRLGDRYAISYLPGVGTTLTLNGRPLGTIAGARFGRAMFSVWFGARPFSPELKRQLSLPLRGPDARVALRGGPK